MPRISEKNIDKPIIIEKDEDLLKPPEEDKEELERQAKEKARLEQEYLEAQKKLLPKDSSIHLTNYYVKDKPFY